jgi:3-dehydroquinate synthase
MKKNIVIPVHLGKLSYEIIVAQHSLNRLGAFLRNKGIGDQDVMVITSPHIGHFYYATVARSLQEAGFQHVVRQNIPDGEQHKNFTEFERCLRALTHHFSDESVPLIINLGGGVVGDLGGFVASAYRRGIDYVQIPTTLLGFVDCGVGGKVGVNFEQVKNLVGAFYQPRLVLADWSVLKTLPIREFRSGLAEVIKYGVVCDRSLFEFLENPDHITRLFQLDPQIILPIIEKSYRIKVRVVELDERDTQDQRIVLNFGHTIGHALEIASQYKLTHGEAVSIGMVAATRLAVNLKYCSPSLLSRLIKVLNQSGLPITAESLGLKVSMIMKIMAHDKKAKQGQLRFVLPTALGQWIVQAMKDHQAVEKVVQSILKKEHKSAKKF